MNPCPPALAVGVQCGGSDAISGPTCAASPTSDFICGTPDGLAEFAGIKLATHSDVADAGRT